MTTTPLTGKVFWKTLRKLGIPASVFAMKAKCSLEKIYKLKDCERVPNKYVKLLEELCQQHQVHVAV